jgi:hypothetical protein
MAPPGKIYAQIDVNFADDARVIEAGRECALMYLYAILDSKRLLTDDILTRAQFGRIAGKSLSDSLATPSDHLRRPCDVGLLIDRGERLDEVIQEARTWLGDHRQISSDDYPPTERLGRK